jgi:hypothetical protein
MTMAIQLQPELPSWINKVTFCFTIGLRPDHLARTLASLAPIMAQATVLAVNDFGDAPTNTAFARGCPHGILVQTTPKIGQHAAVDAMYRRVTTPFVFHCEDDWMFDRNDIVPSALALLATDAAMSGVGFRHMSDFPAEIGQSPSIRRTTAAGVQHLRLDDLHDQWYGYSFNPHLARLATWQQTGGFAQFKKERHISRYLRARGQHIAFLDPGACHHIGDDISVTVRKIGLATRLKQWIRNR